jgi:hypothetical protein
MPTGQLKPHMPHWQQRLASVVTCCSLASPVFGAAVGSLFTKRFKSLENIEKSNFVGNGSSFKK